VQIFSKELKIDSFSIYREYLQLPRSLLPILLPAEYFREYRILAFLFLLLNQRATVEKVKFWLIEKLEKYMPKS
jgi:hypothetical protein